MLAVRTLDLGRRDFLKTAAVLPLVSRLSLPLDRFLPRRMRRSAEVAGGGRRHAGRGSPLSVVVVGAGAFGGWTALWLRRSGARVTLVDAWGPGSPRASSGGETRVIRGVYGPNPIYVNWAARSLALWRESEERWHARLYRRTGGLWMFDGDDTYARSALPLLAEVGLPARELSLVEARARFPQISFDGVASVFYEDETGYLRARHACQAVAEAFVADGGTYRQALVEPGEIRGGTMAGLRLSDGERLAADAYVFACGPWLGTLFPEVIGGRVQPSRQEVFYFGTPAGSDLFDESRFPCWLFSGERFFYGIPGNDGRGFKIADDTRGGPVDPTTLERTTDPEDLERARRFLAHRFPALADAPLVESRVCQYENSPDGDFILDRHPEAANAWLLGGGSGHGFKMGPAVGEFAAGLVLGERDLLPEFQLARFG